MNMGRSIAKVVEKCYKGKASIKDISFLLNSVLDGTTLGNDVKKKLPGLSLTMEGKVDGALVVLGEYSDIATTIYINNVLVERARNGIGHSLFQLIETYGHEMTHHKQHLTGNLNKLETPNYNQQAVKGMCQVVGLDVGEELCKNIAHASYLKRPYEVEARDGGAVFAVEVFELLLQNKYFKPEFREKILSDLELARKNMEEHEQKNEVYYRQYDQFIEFFKSRNIKNFMDDNDRSSYFDCYKAFDLWSSQNSPETLCRGYLTLIGSGNKHMNIRHMLVNRINSQDFPQKMRSKMIDSIVSTLKKGELDEQYYERELTEVLEDKQIFEIYRELFVKDLKKLDGSLFFQFEFDEQYAPVIGKIIVDNLNDIKINSEEDISRLASKVGLVLISGEKTLSPELRNQLCEIKSKIDNKMKVTQTTKR